LRLWRLIWISVAAGASLLGILFALRGLVVSQRMPLFVEPVEDEKSLAAGDPFLLRMREAEKLAPASSPYPTIAVIDSGLDLELAVREGVALAEAELRSFNLVPGASRMEDDLSHGTGLFLRLAARKNGWGTVGLVPDATVLPLRLGSGPEFESGGVPFERLDRAFALAAGAGTKIVSLSVSNVRRYWPEAGMAALLRRHAGILVVAAAGNDAWKLDYGDDCAYVPVCVSAPNLLKVGAKDFPRSNRGAPIELWALSRSLQWRKCGNEGKAPIYCLREVTSTSVVVPKAVALAALVIRLKPRWPPERIKKVLIQASAGGDLDPLTAVRAALIP